MPARRTKPKRPTPTRPASFDEQKYAGEAVVENIYTHTVGLAGYPPIFLGSAVPVRWRDRTLLVTADHVIREAKDDDLRFAPRPPVPLKLNEASQEARSGAMHRLEQLPVIRRYRDQERDIAALEVPQQLEQQTPLRFYDLGESLTLPRPMPEHVAMIGFPGDALEQQAPGVWAFSGYLLVAQSQRYAGQELKKFLPRSDFLLTFPPAKDGRNPRGFSGTGVWYQPSTPRTELWSPRLSLLGICTGYYEYSELLCALRIERVLTFLRRALR